MNTSIFIKRLFLVSLLMIAVCFVLTPMGTVSASEKPGLSRNIDSGDETFDRIFKEGRDLVDKEEWAKSIEKFKEIVCDCPEKKYVDVAFYWMARSYKKLKMYKEANETINRLLKNFPGSSWADDARVLMYQIPGTVTYSRGEAGVRTPQPIITGQGELLATYVAGHQTQLDREDEIRLAAFQSLLGSEPKRGIEVLADILRADSKSSETLKREVIRTLRGSSYRGFYAGHWVLAPSTTVPETQNLSLLRETLVRSFQNNQNSKVRAEIIYSLIAFNDEQSVAYLSQLYSSAGDREIKKAIINAFGSAGTGYFSGFGSYSYTPMLTTAATLNRIQAETTVAQSRLDETRAEIASGQNQTVVATPKPPTEAPKASSSSPRPTADTSKAAAKSAELRKIYFDKLMEITRSEKDLELKRLAFYNLQKFSGWSTRDGMFETLSQMYDVESDEQFKISLIQGFSNMKQDQATSKLLNIARSDKSDKLRLEAIYSLRGNKNPEVIKFLEDLIK